jgi:hypothetical protein
MNSDMREKVVKRLIRSKANDILGGLENSILDKEIDEMPPREDIFADIYDDVINADYYETSRGALVPVHKDIRFLGKSRIESLINERLDKEGI